MNECPGWERLSDRAGWTAGERAHVAACARCAAFVAEYTAFLAGDERLPPGDRHDADRRLGEFVREQVLSAVPVTRASESPEPGVLSRLLAWFAAPQGRWATSLAVVVLVAGIFVTTRQDELPVGRVQRGAESAAFAATVTAGADGGAQLRWPAAPQADGYRVEALGADLAVVQSFDVSAALEWKLEPGAAPGAAYVRVVALRRGDRLGETALVAIPGR